MFQLCQLVLVVTNVDLLTAPGFTSWVQCHLEGEEHLPGVLQPAVLGGGVRGGGQDPPQQGEHAARQQGLLPGGEVQGPGGDLACIQILGLNIARINRLSSADNDIQCARPRQGQSLTRKYERAGIDI